VTASVLVIGGDRDNHTVENVAALYRAIPGSRLWIVPGQGHFMFWPALGGDAMWATKFLDVLHGFLG
jgi:pimeloyl-ACP methyl ester carboxylesterase